MNILEDWCFLWVNGARRALETTSSLLVAEVPSARLSRGARGSRCLLELAMVSRAGVLNERENVVDGWDSDDEECFERKPRTLAG